MNSPSRSLPLWLRAVIFAVAYAACAAFSGYFTHWTNTVSYLWLPSGLYVGGLLLSRPRHWPVLVIAAGVGDFAFNYLSNPWPVPEMLLAHQGNSLSAVLGAWLVRYFIAERPTLKSVRELAGVIGLGGVLSLVPSALNGAFLIHHVAPEEPFWDSFIAWYTSDLLGVILLTPAILAWQKGIQRPITQGKPTRALELAALLTGLCAVTGSAFYFHWLRQTETLYVASPFIIWAALRFGLRGATLTILITAILAQFFTALGYGALGGSTLTASQKSVEMMVSLGVFSITGLVPATVFSALKAAQAREAVRTHTMTLVAMGAKLPAILDSIVLGVEAEHPEMLCSILLLDQSGSQLLVASAPSFPLFYNRAIHGVTIGPNVGSCGAAAFLDKRVIAEDIRTDPRWVDYRKIAAQAGLTSCWSEPFHNSAGRLLGTFAIYHRVPARPTDADISLIAAVSQIAAIATERKQLEEQFLRAQRMESIGTLAGGIAHDFNNLLTPIIMSAGLLKHEGNDKESQQMLTTIDLCARRGASLVKQVLTFARGVEGSRIALNVGLIVNEIEAITANTFPKNIEFNSDIPREVPLVLGDRTQLEQVLLNLSVNARDAMPKGGRISITARPRVVDEKTASLHPGVVAGDYLEIQVSDTGRGMSPEVIPRIFEPFYTSKEAGRGTGLGLSTVLGIVRSHGGFIDVTSNLGQGSSFRVCLPALAAGILAVENTEDVQQIPRGEGELVLLVDDELAILQTTTQALSSFGYRVIIAENGADALDQMNLHRSKIAVVVTDMMMPVMDGRELIGELRKLEPDLRIITVSGLKAEVAVAGLGVQHHLAKPYSADGLYAILARVLGKMTASTS